MEKGSLFVLIVIIRVHSLNCKSYRIILFI